MNTEDGPKRSQRARERAGWVWIRCLAPPELKRQLNSLASAHGLSLTQALLDGMHYLAYGVPREWWVKRQRANKTRFGRSDRGKPRGPYKVQRPRQATPENGAGIIPGGGAGVIVAETGGREEGGTPPAVCAPQPSPLGRAPVPSEER